MRYKIILLILILLMTIFEMFNEKGLITFLRLKDQYSKLISENETLKKNNQSIYKEIQLLKEDRSYIEKIAREEMGMVKKDEIIIRFDK